MKIISIFLITILIAFTSAATGSVLCRALYFDVTTIAFGRLFHEAHDRETLEALNAQSRDHLLDSHYRPEDSATDHMINTLLYYRSLERFVPKDKIGEEFSHEFYDSIYAELEKQLKKTNPKFNRFKRYLKRAVEHPDHHED